MCDNIDLAKIREEEENKNTEKVTAVYGDNVTVNNNEKETKENSNLD